MEGRPDVILETMPDGIGTEVYGDYLAHAVCTGGRCTFSFNGRPFKMAEGDLIMVCRGKLVSNIRKSEDFRVKVLYVTASFIEQCTPLTNYGIRGSMALFFNPVMNHAGTVRPVRARI